MKSSSFFAMLFNRVMPISNVKLIWERLTASRLAIVYIVFSIFNCTIQVIFQAQAFSINRHATDFLSELILSGNASLPGFFVLGSQLHFCDHVPKSLSTESCQLVWNGTLGRTESRSTISIPYVQPGTPLSPSSLLSTFATLTSQTTTSSSSPTTNAHTTTTPIESLTVDPSLEVLDLDSFNDKRSFLPKPQIDVSSYIPIVSNGETGVRLQGFGPTRKDVTLDNRCLIALNWPVQTLSNTKREDVAFLTFQFWVLGMSLVAVLNESIPHIIATVLTHLSATAWGGFQIYNTSTFHEDFKRLTTDGTCQINLLPSYWTSRGHAEIPSLAFNVVDLLVSCFLSFKLIKLFGWQTFKRVGASRKINRIYKVVLTLSIVIQLSLFFVVLAVALWLDQLCHGAIAVMATRSGLYQALLMVVIVLLIPWLLTGWFAARKELKFPMMVFLVLSALYLVGWGLMFDSGTFRWTFVQWGFFGATVSLSALLVLIGFILGIVCQLNFDKGLVNYLSAGDSLQDDSFIQCVPGAGDPFDEKFDFPSTHLPIPTFLLTVGSNDKPPLPSQMRFQTGPRFFNLSTVPVDLRPDTDSITMPFAARSMSQETDAMDITRALTHKGNQHSTSSQASSTVTMNEPFTQQSRWVIE